MAGAPQGRRPDLEGGGLRRSLGRWTAVERLRRGREQWAGDERILGSSEFVAAVQQSAATRETPSQARAARQLAALVSRCAERWDVNTTELIGGSRHRSVARVRAFLGYPGVPALGLAIARHLGVTPAAIHHGLGRGAALVADSGCSLKTLLDAEDK